MSRTIQTCGIHMSGWLENNTNPAAIPHMAIVNAVSITAFFKVRILNLLYRVIQGTKKSSEPVFIAYLNKRPKKISRWGEGYEVKRMVLCHLIIISPSRARTRAELER